MGGNDFDMMFADDDDFMDFINSMGKNYQDKQEHDTKKDNYKKNKELID